MTQNNVGIYASQISGHLYSGPYGSYDSLATVTLSAATSSITFAGIPSGYKHLQLRATMLADTSNSDFQVIFNGDTGNNYSQHYLYGTGASVASSGGANQPFYYLAFNAGNGTYPISSVSDYLDYTNTNKYKTARNLSGFDRNGSGQVNLTSGAWLNTAAISSLTIFTNSGNFTQYSQFALYGVK